MKKAAEAIPNHQLRRARESRGWSQEYLAEQIGVTAFTVGRWERGVTLPTPHFRRKLSDVLLLNVRQLGLMVGAEPVQQAQQHETGFQSAPAVSTPSALSHEPPPSGVGHTSLAIPPLPPHALPLIGREQLHTHITTLLSHDEPPSLPVTLYGLPGAGKTTLASAVAHEAALHHHFADGILWCGLGPAPNLHDHLLGLGLAVGIAQGELAAYRTIEELAKAIYAAIGSRRLLLVLDDVWRLEDALALCVGGPRCAHLLTTRFPEIAFRLSRDHALPVPELSEDSGVKLLKRLAPEAVTREPDAAYTLVRSVGALPLALTLIGDYLYVQTRSNQSRRLRAALERLTDAEQRLQLEQPRSPLQTLPGAGSSSGAISTISLQAAIAVSTQSLDEAAHQVLAALALFSAKPNTFSEAAALAVAGCATETLDTLACAGLCWLARIQRTRPLHIASDDCRLCPRQLQRQRRRHPQPGDHALYCLGSLLCARTYPSTREPRR